MARPDLLQPPVPQPESSGQITKEELLNSQSMIRSLTNEEVDLFAKKDTNRDEQTAVPARQPEPQPAKVVFQAPQPSSGVKKEPTRQINSSNQREMGRLQRRRNELLRGNKGRRNKNIRSQLAAIDRDISRLGSAKKSSKHHRFRGR